MEETYSHSIKPMTKLKQKRLSLPKVRNCWGKWAHVSQEELVRRMREGGATFCLRSYCDWENGLQNPQKSKLEQIARFYGVAKPGSLLG